MTERGREPQGTAALPVLEERLGALGIPVYVYSEFHAGEAATEPGLAAAPVAQ
jgi:hypothetical protein